MKKYIYIIKNKCNNKVYIGQTNNPKQRWMQHISNSKTKNVFSLIDLAIEEIGVNNFFMEILEETENYDERERFWISRYNSTNPNGYNISIGGASIGQGVDSVVSAIRTREQLFLLMKEIKTTEKTFDVIAKEWGVSPSTISSINIGRYYYCESVKYPLRKKRISENTAALIRKELKENINLSSKEISQKYEIDLSTINEINYGRTYKSEDYTYPIRTGKVYNKLYHFVDDIIKDLSTTEIPMKDLASKYGVTRSQISSINLGRSYRKDNIHYPIRITYEQNKSKISRELEEKIISEILRGEKTCKEISKHFSVKYFVVLDIKNKLT